MTDYSFEYEILDSPDQLERDEHELFSLAEKQLDQAYAPYSKFYVSAAILLDDGNIVTGSNQENASYSLCMCAERVALYSMTSNYPGATPLKMAIVANNPKKAIDKAIPPCGACRQVILEFETRFENPIMILLKDDVGNYYRFSNSRQLLPLAFDKSYLNNNGK